MPTEESVPPNNCYRSPQFLFLTREKVSFDQSIGLNLKRLIFRVRGTGGAYCSQVKVNNSSTELNGSAHRDTGHIE